MKIFHRVLAMVLALIMSFAVLPLSAFASDEDPWVEVGSGTQASPDDPESTIPAIVVKVNAEKLVELLKSGETDALKETITSGIFVDIASILNVITVEELLEIISAEDILNNIGLEALLEELGDKVDVYFDLGAIVKDLQAKEKLDDVIKTEDALNTILSYYEGDAEGLTGLLERLLAVEGEDADENGIPDNCPIDIHELAGASFWHIEENKIFFNDNVFDIEVEKYIESEADLEVFLRYWPKDDATGQFDVSFFEDGDLDINGFIAAAENGSPNGHIVNYIHLDEILNDHANDDLIALLRSNPQKYFGDDGMTLIEGWINAKTDWDLDDFNADALKAALNVDDNTELAKLLANNPDTVKAKVAEDPATYLTDAALNEILSVDHMKSLADHFKFNDFRADAKAEGIDETRFYSYIEKSKYLHDNIDFLVKNIKTFVTDEGIDHLHHNIDIAHLATEGIGIEKIIQTEGLANIVACLNLDKVVEAIGKENLATYVDLPLAIEAIGVDQLLSIIKDAGKSVTDLVDMEKFVAAIDAKMLIGQLSPEEIAEIWETETVKAALDNLRTLLLSKIPYVINEFSIDGHVVAKDMGDTSSGRLIIDIDAFLAALINKLPTLEDIANLNSNTLLSFDIDFDYEKLSGGTANKLFGIQLVLDGDIEQVKSAAAKANSIISKFVYYEIKPDLSVVLDVRIPAQAMTYYAEILRSADLDEAEKDRLAKLVDASKDAIGFLKTITFEDLVLILKGIDTEALLDKLAQISYVNGILEEYAAKTGKDVSSLTTGEILAALDDAVDKAGSNSLVDKVFSIINDKFGIDPETVLDRAEMMQELEDIIDNENRATYKNAFNTVKSYAISAISRVNSLAPDLLTKPLGEMYRGDGTFQINSTVAKNQLNAQNLAEKLADKLFGGDQEMVDLIKNFFPADYSLEATVDVTVQIEDFYRVTYHDINAKPLQTVFLPKGASLNAYRYEPEEAFVVTGWLSGGKPVTTVTGDMAVYPVFEASDYTMVTFYAEDGVTVLQSFYKKIGSFFSADELASVVYKKAVDEGYENVWEWKQDGWALLGDAEQNVIDFATQPVTEDMKLVPSFRSQTKVYFDPVYGPFTQVVEDGYLIALDGLFAGNDEILVKIPQKLIDDENADIILTDTATGVTVKIDEETLTQMDLLSSGLTLRFVAHDVFENGVYNQNNAVKYTLDFLVGKNNVSYTELIGRNKNFAGSVQIVLPFENAISAEDGKQATHVYYVDGEARELINATVENGSAEFVAPHFSEFIIANEYAVYHRFQSTNTTATVTGTVSFMDEAHPYTDYTYLPVGAYTFTAAITAPEHYEIVRTVVAENAFDDASGVAVDGTFTVADQALYLTVEAEFTQTYKVTFLFGHLGNNEYLYKQEYTVRYGKTIGEAIPTPDTYFEQVGETRLEYGLSYWKTENGDVYDGVANELPNNVVITGDMTFIGKAEPIATYHKVTFYHENGDLYKQIWVKDGERISATVLEELGTPEKTSTDSTVKYDFSAWLDADGGVANLDALTIGDTTTFTASFDTSYLVTFKDGDTQYKQIWVKDGETLAENEEFRAMLNPSDKDAADLDQYLFTYVFSHWTLDGAQYNLATAVTGAIVLEAAYTEDYLINKVNPDLADDIDAYFEKVEQGNDVWYDYVITLKDELDVVHLPAGIGEFASVANANARLIIRLVDANGNTIYQPVVMNKTMLAHLYANNAVDVSIAYKAIADFSAGEYDATNAFSFRFEIKCDGVAYEPVSDDVLTVRVPFEWLANAYNGRTLIYRNGNALALHVKDTNKKVTLASGTKLLQFVPDSLSASWIFVNEYGIVDGGATHADTKLPTPAPAIDATISGFDADTFYQKGDVIVVTPSGITANYEVVDLYYVNAAGKTVKLEKLSATTWKLVVPAETVVLKASLMPKSFKVNYYVPVNGEYVLSKTDLYNKHMIALDQAAIVGAHNLSMEQLAKNAALPVGYEFDAWIGYGEDALGTADMNVYLTYAPITYTLNFVDPGDPEDPEDDETVHSVTFTIETVALGEVLIPSKEGHTVACPALADFDILAAITEMTEAGTTETALELVYTACTYTIIYDETQVTVTGDAIYGSEITVEILDREFYKEALTVVTINGEKVSVKNGKFTMPDASVKIEVSYTPTGNAVYYINNRPQYGAMVGDVVTFEIRFTNGYRLASVSDFCSLVNTTVEDDMYVLVYSFDVKDGLHVNYAIEEVAYDDKNIVNGTEHQGTGAPIVNEDQVTFNGWSADILGAISFATFGLEDTATIVWLWILIAFVLLVVILAVLYKLYTLGKLKNNCITRFVAWIVTGFLAVCRFVAKIGLGILGIFGKKEEDLDFTEPEEEAAEEVSEEAPATEAPEEEAETEEADDESEDNA